MHGLELVQDLAVVMASAAVATILCQRFKQPVVLGYIVAGIFIGPNTPPVSLVTDEEAIKTLSELGVILLMFSIGIHFSFRKLREVGMAAVVAAVVAIGLFSFEALTMSRKAATSIRSARSFLPNVLRADRSSLDGS